MKTPDLRPEFFESEHIKKAKPHMPAFQLLAAGDAHAHGMNQLVDNLDIAQVTVLADFIQWGNGQRFCDCVDVTGCVSVGILKAGVLLPGYYTDKYISSEDENPPPIYPKSFFLNPSGLKVLPSSLLR